MKPSVLNPSEQEALREVLSQEFARLNAEYFQGGLKMPVIVVSSRKTYGGYYQPRLHRIVVSWQAHREHGIVETLNTFRHEVAHIVHPHHRADFWALAHVLGVTRRYAMTPLVTRPPRLPKYLYVCPACSKQILRYRRLKLSSCASCDPRFNLKFVLRLIPREMPEPESCAPGK
jgi:predicted SprT family Zn-dependent metalloprotease